MNETATKDVTKPFPLPSGATLHMGRPAFADAGRLRNALARAAMAKPPTPDEMKAGLDSLKTNPAAGGALLQRVLSVVASEEVEACLFSCLRVASYQPSGANARLKVTPELFDHEQFGDAARTDYYPIFYRAAEVAVMPFLGALVSMYKEYLSKSANAPASRSTSEAKGS